METKDAYNQWAKTYDQIINKTRDLEGKALREQLSKISFQNCLEIGCGTGKNTEWLLGQSARVTAVDVSEEMTSEAKKKISSDRVVFELADVTAPWTFRKDRHDLVVFSLILEHIENLDHVFLETAKSLEQGGYLYIGELHPFKQYAGSKARFETEEGLQILASFTHHLSEYFELTRKHGFILANLEEYFDDCNKTGIPRILSILLKMA